MTRDLYVTRTIFLLLCFVAWMTFIVLFILGHLPFPRIRAGD